jgi:4'-phosphopantetheinyl transferase
MSALSWQPSAHQPLPAPDEIHVWRIDLAAASCAPADAGLLSPDEHERAGRLLSEHKRARFIAGRSVLRRLLGRYLDEKPRSLVFHYGPHGKPALAARTSTEALTFNFSHSEDLALLAVATGREVGIDIEYRHRTISVDSFARHILCDHEAVALQRLPADRRQQALLATWTRKEAYVKALGEGLSRSMRSFSAEIAEVETTELRLEDAGGEPVTWKFTPLAVHPDYLACLTAPGSDWTPCCFDWQSAP